MVGCLTRIQRNSGERWRLSVDDLSTLAQAMISGMHVQFFLRGADRTALEVWWQEARMVVDALARLAEPGSDPSKYRRMRLPAQVAAPRPDEGRQQGIRRVQPPSQQLANALGAIEFGGQPSVR